MADAKKCDRCGKYYQVAEPNAAEMLYSSVVNAVSDFVTPPNVSKQISAIECLLDLCDDCKKSLKRWVKCKDDLAVAEQPEVQGNVK